MDFNSIFSKVQEAQENLKKAQEGLGQHFRNSRGWWRNG